MRLAVRRVEKSPPPVLNIGELVDLLASVFKGHFVWGQLRWVLRDDDRGYTEVCCDGLEYAQQQVKRFTFDECTVPLTSRRPAALGRTSRMDNCPLMVDLTLR